MSKSLTLILIGLLLSTLPKVLFAQPEHFYLDRLHSSVNFSMKYIEIMEFTGRADDYYGEFYYDRKNVNNSKIYFVVDARSLNTAMPNRDLDLHSAEYMDTETFPAIIFKSAKVINRNGQLTAMGSLTIKDVTDFIELPYEIKAERADARKLMVVKVGPIAIDRSKFGIGTTEKNKMGKIFLGDEIKIWADVLLKAEGEDETKLKAKFSADQVSSLPLENFTGTYKTEKGTVWSVLKFDSKLFLVFKTAAIFYGMTPVENDTFIIDDVGSLLKFQMNPSGIPSGLIYRLDEDESKWLKMAKE